MRLVILGIALYWRADQTESEGTWATGPMCRIQRLCYF